MRLAKLFAVSAGALAASATLSSPRTLDLQSLTHQDKGPPFIVDVVANGVPPDGKSYVPTPDQTEQTIGLDLWIGATTAYNDLKNASKDHVLPFELKPLDDKDKEENAREIAKNIQLQPQVLAVVGHGITLTTYAAANAYDQAGIPLIVALATADAAVSGDGHQSRLPVSFRLSPSDGAVEAPAIAYFINDHLPSTLAERQKFDVHLFVSTADHAGAYAAPLCNQANDILQANHLTSRVTTIDADTVNEIAQKHDAVDFIVYCGYGPDATRLLQGLSQLTTKSDGTPLPPDGTGLPQIILSSAVQEEDLKGFKNLRLFRMSALNTKRCADQDALKRITAEAVKVNRPATPTLQQIHGYDAVQVIAAAAQKCAGRLSRSCVLEELGRGQTLPSVCSDYSFRDGENIISDYFVYPAGNVSTSLTRTNAPCDDSQVITVTPPEVLHMLRERDQAATKKGQ